MSKAANTYWDRKTTGARSRSGNRTAAVRATQGFKPTWFMMMIPVALCTLLVLMLNVRVWTNVQTEVETNQKLGTQIEQLTTENELLQDEINRLQYDPKTIEREARKLGMGRANEKVFVPTH